MGSNMGSLQQLGASQLKYAYVTAPREVPNVKTLASSYKTICTDHMIVAFWNADSGWSVPELKPYGPFSLLPSASCLHYAYECFQGLKAYRGDDGKLRMFRADFNARRLLMSAERISLPQLDPDELEKLIYAFISVGGSKWLPKSRTGDFLYVRPTIIGIDSQLGVAQPTEALLYIIVGYMARMDTPVGGKRLLTNPDDIVRSWVGGFGYAKVGANYGPSVLATQEAYRQGYHQILWLYGPEGDCNESDGSNSFVIWKRKDGKKELITAPLNYQLILNGVSRRSCLDLARERLKDELEVAERKFTIGELQDAAAKNRLLESFAAGTTWFITLSPQSTTGEKTSTSQPAPMAYRLKSRGEIKGWLGGMMYGRVEHEWARVVPEKAR